MRNEPWALSMQKQAIVAELGEAALLRPTQVNAALGANERAKYYFTLLQSARMSADHPEHAVPSLQREREVAGIGEQILDEVVRGTSKDGERAYRIPHSQAILHALLDAVDTMLLPLQDQDRAAAQARLATLRAAMDNLPDGRLTTGALDTLTSASRDHGDSVHLLVMDVHKLLNAAQVQLSSESIEGAHTYALLPADRPLVEAFMRGISRTSKLRFDHPGLVTTATRDAARLILQNDIGTTDAHVLVVHVEELACTVTYSDVHLRRLVFFQEMFERYDVDWQDVRSRRTESFDDGLYHLCIGTYRAPDSGALADYLAFLGSRLVFLIDWNRARKRLQVLLPKRDALDLLAWAARSECGHMAFLRAGGDALVFDVLELAARARAQYGKSLSDIIGRAPALEYMRFVLQTCAEAALAGHADALVQDALRAELLNYVRSSQERQYDLIGEQAALMHEVACAIREALMACGMPGAAAVLADAAQRAKMWEAAADDILNQLRRSAETDDRMLFFVDLAMAADDVVDALEDASFHLSLLDAAATEVAVSSHLLALGESLVTAAQEYVRLVETARTARSRGARHDTHDLIGAVHRIAELEHMTDERQRSAKRDTLDNAEHCGKVYVLLAVIARLEQAADHMTHCALRIRDHVLGELERQ